VEDIEKRMATLEERVRKQRMIIRFIQLTLITVILMNISIQSKIYSIFNSLEMITRLIENLITSAL
jgi:hypothetical protein